MAFTITTTFVLSFLCFMIAQSYNGAGSEGAISGLLWLGVSAILFCAGTLMSAFQAGVLYGRRHK